VPGPTGQRRARPRDPGGECDGAAGCPERSERSATLLAGSVRAFMWVVTDGGAVLGVITLSDVLRRLFPQPTAAAA
jgi:CBS domain-containing protein